ncbi:MAG: hypothetical protein H6959_09970 [Chromatiaceae bacterium]|nr:hypothetical protein [Gammaproteobacteria bacterium]MCP5298227.1 hypothetical protein [Chromatiaceae bacterium]MCP5423233.1 hypothetical protein [Chromatiaceae bacterium]
MALADPQLAGDWLNYAKASLGSRAAHMEEVTAVILASVRRIAIELEDKSALAPLLELEGERIATAQLLESFGLVLEQLDKHDALAQLIYPLFATLQFEDRTRQKLDTIIHVLQTWADTVESRHVEHAALSQRLMSGVIAMEQQAILARYFPEHIESTAGDDSGGDIDLF